MTYRIDHYGYPCDRGSRDWSASEREYIPSRPTMLCQNCWNWTSDACRGPDMNEAIVTCCIKCCQRIHHDGCKEVNSPGRAASGGGAQPPTCASGETDPPVTDKRTAGESWTEEDQK